jgi:hypothetical protein
MKPIDLLPHGNYGSRYVAIRPVAAIFAPFAGNTTHLGHRRATRFSRWLTLAGYDIVILGADACSIPGCRFVTVPDPLGVWSASCIADSLPDPRPEKGGRGIARRVLVPDPSIAWALRACCSREAHAVARSSAVLISTGPPESPHLAASFLSRVTGVPHLIDYRDGWIDEPLKAEIRDRGIRRSFEERLEAWALGNAGAVTVTSESWAADLAGRHPCVGSRIHTLTNVIPTEYQPAASRGEMGGIPRLIYAGRLSGSRSTQSAGLLLDVLAREAAAVRAPFEVLFLGDLSGGELMAIERFGASVAEFGWTVRHQRHCDYRSSLAEIAQADAMLLISASSSAVPSKLFDYLATGRPILCVAPRGSAVWELCRELKQVWMIDPTSNSREVGFCVPESLNRRYRPPIEFTEAHVADRFVKLVASVRDGAPPT